MENKIFIKDIDDEAVQVITIFNGKVYIDILMKEEAKEIYNWEE